MLRMDKTKNDSSNEKTPKCFSRGRLKLVFMYDLRNGVHYSSDSHKDGNTGHPKQSPAIIKLYRIGIHLRQRTIPILNRVALYIIVSLIISLGFALQYERILKSDHLKQLYIESVNEKQSTSVHQLSQFDESMFADAISSDNFLRILKNSFIIFQLWSIFTDNGQPEFLDNISEITNGVAIDDFSSTMLFERLIGTIATACLIGSIASQFESSLNPIWHAPKIVIDTSGEAANFDIRYWIRYPPDRWLHRVTLVVRIRSYDSDRSSENHQLTEYFYEENLEIRRGICRLRINLEQDRKLLELLTKMKVAKDALQGKPIVQIPSLWSSDKGLFEDYMPNSDEIRAYSGYSIQFRIIGTTDDGEEISSEYLYGIDDVLFGYSLVDGARSHVHFGKEVDGQIGNDRLPYAKKYSYYEAWYVEPSVSEKYSRTDISEIPLLEGLKSINRAIHTSDLTMIKHYDYAIPLQTLDGFNETKDYNKYAQGFSYMAINDNGSCIRPIACIVFQTLSTFDYVFFENAGFSQSILSRALFMTMWISDAAEIANDTLSVLMNLALFEAESNGYKLSICRMESSSTMTNHLKKFGFRDYAIVKGKESDTKKERYMIYIANMS